MRNVLSRTSPRDPGNRRLTVRDLLGLQFIAEAQPVTTSQYRALLGVARPIAWRSLQKLRDFNCVHVHVESMEADSRFTLAVGGARVLALKLGRSPEEFRVPRGAGASGAHHRAAVDFYVLLSVATSRSGALRLTRFAFEAELRRRAPGPRALVPDAVAVLESHELTCAFAVEVDLATENPSYVATQKFVPYADLVAAGAPLLGVPSFKVLVLAPSERRLHVLARAAWTAGVDEGLLYFAVLGSLSDREVLVKGWRTPRLDPSGEHAVLAPESPFRGLHDVEAARTECSFRSSGQPDATGENRDAFANGPGGPFGDEGGA